MHRREFLAMAGATLAAGPFQQGLRPGPELARAHRQGHPALCAGRCHRRDRPALGRQALPGLRPAVRDREPRRRQRHDRRRGRGQVGARRLHLPAHAQTRRCRCCRACARRPTIRIKSFDPVGRVGDVINGFVIHPSVGVKTFKEMVEYAKKNPGKLDLRLLGQRHVHASAAGDAEVQDRHRHPARPLSRRRRHLQRRAAGHRAHDERAGLAAARQGRQADPAQHQRPGAPPGLSRCAHADRARRHRRGRADLVLDLRPGRARPRTSSPSSMPR